VCDEPEFVSRATGEESIEEIRIKKKILLSKQDQQKEEEIDAERTYIESVPNEVIKMEGDCLIRNFEVEFVNEEEICYAGGVKGIKALRMQRDLIHETHETEKTDPYSGNKFAEIEEQKDP
jgi:hypothetical protein